MSAGTVRVATGLACVSLVSCTGPDRQPAYVVRDSAGVQIVESTRPIWSDEVGWRVSAQASLRIGVQEGSAPYQFSGVVGAVRLGDGTIAVADAGSQEVRLFDADGSFLRALGGAGAGPGEFSGLSGLGHAPEGGVWAYDFSLRRVTWLDAAGTVVGTTAIGPDPPMLNPIGALADGSLVMKQAWGAQQTAEATQTGLRRDPVAYVRIDTDGAVRDTVGLFPGREVILMEEDGRGVMTTPPFGRTSYGSIQADAIVVGSTTRFELDVHSADGRLLRRLRILGRDLALRPGQLEDVIEQRVAATPEARRPELRALYASLPVPDAMPAHGAILADAIDNLWVAEWTPDPTSAAQWTVLAPDGHWLGEVAMPMGFYPTDIGAAWILGVERDALDVESIVVYPLEKPST